jgi:hypothetical protein
LLQITMLSRAFREWQMLAAGVGLIVQSRILQQEVVSLNQQLRVSKNEVQKFKRKVLQFGQ